MKKVLPDYPLADLHGSPIDQLGQFEEIVEEAERSGVATCVAANAEESHDTKTQHVRIHTIATRLYLLGYLSRRIPRRRLAKKIDKVREAVGRFQKEAALTVDYWVGDVTWHALDELVSFESRLSPEKWFIGNRVRPELKTILQRATRLRLWSLGLCKTKPKAQLIELGQKSFQKVEAVIHAFRMKSPDFKADFNQATLELLFDQDTLIQTIATQANPEGTTWMLDLSRDSNLRNSSARSFVLNCAKVELWLLGYDVKIDGRSDYNTSASNDLYQALANYYRDFNELSHERANQLAKNVTPQLFLGLAETNQQASSIDEDDASAMVAEQVSTESEIEEAWTYVQKRSLSLWDGLKRVWRWIKKLGKRALSFIRNNLFRGFFRFVNKAYKIVVSGISAVASSIQVLLKGKLRTPGVTYAFSNDLDTVALAPSKATFEQIRLSLSQRTRQTKAFSVACRITALVFSVFKSQILTVFGWARFLLSLVSSYRDLKRLYTDFKALSTTPELTTMNASTL